MKKAAKMNRVCTGAKAKVAQTGYEKSVAVTLLKLASEKKVDKIENMVMDSIHNEVLALDVSLLVAGRHCCHTG